MQQSRSSKIEHRDHLQFSFHLLILNLSHSSPLTSSSVGDHFVDAANKFMLFNSCYLFHWLIKKIFVSGTTSGVDEKGEVVGKGGISPRIKYFKM